MSRPKKMNLAAIQAFAGALESKELPHEGDEPYATRYIVRKTDAGSVYLQHLRRADLDPAPHQHPWSFMRTTILHGGYEHHWGTIYGGVYYDHGERHYGAGDGYALDGHDVHRIVRVWPDTWTLLFVGPKRQDWGFWVEGRGLVPWQERFRERGVEA